MKALISITLVFLTIPSLSQQLVWASLVQGSGPLKATDLCVGSDQSVVSVGELRETADFDPGQSVLEYTGTFPFNSELYLQKLHPDGSLDWVLTNQGIVVWSNPSIVKDDFDQLYVTGGFSINGDIDPGPAEIFVEAQSDVVILKLDSDGNVLWAKVLGDGDFWNQEANDIAIDVDGNIITTGYFSGVADFDPGPDTLLFDSYNGRGFIHKMDNDGNLLWAGQFAGDGIYNEGQTLDTDAEGNIYVAGIYTYPSDFDIGPDTVWIEDNSGRDAFIMKYSPDGELLWVNSFAGPGEEWPFGMDVSDAGDLICTGRFEDTLDFDPGPGIHDVISAGNRDAFVLKLDTDGELDWVNTYGSTDFDVGSNVIQGKYGQIHVVGGFTDTVAFNGPDSDYTFVTAELGDAEGFILTLDSIGDFIWAGQMGVNPIAIDQDTTGSLYCAGYFLGTVDLDPSPFSEALYTSTLFDDSTYSFDAYVLKLNMDSLLTSSVEDEVESGLGVAVWPNPSSGRFLVGVRSEMSDVRYEITDIRGRVIENRISSNTDNFHIELNGEKGVYFLEVLSGQEKRVIKLIKQ